MSTRSAEYIRGYIAALRWAHQTTRTEHAVAVMAHDGIRPTFFGLPKRAHFEALGRGRASYAIGTRIYEEIKRLSDT